MQEEVDGRPQGGIVRFPLKFDTGIMRARFNPADGQLYVAGLRGWQTDAGHDGALQRVRYTGKTVRDMQACTSRRPASISRSPSRSIASRPMDPQNYSVAVVELSVDEEVRV